MQKLSFSFWALVFLAGGLLGAGLVLYTAPGTPGALPRHQQRVLRARTAQGLQRVAADTLRAAQAAARGRGGLDSARAAAQRAASLRFQTHRHAPLPHRVDSTAEQLQRFFSTY